jgi:hypothetical protein
MAPNFLTEPTKKFEVCILIFGTEQMSFWNFGTSSWTSPWGGITAMIRWPNSNRHYYAGLAPYGGTYMTTFAGRNTKEGDFLYHLQTSVSYTVFYAPEYLQQIGDDYLVGVSSAYDINH